MERNYDVVIVGARIAGAVTAALLGDAGYRVLLLDRATFPSPTLSTHFFRGAYMLTILKRLDILEKALALGSPRYHNIYWYGHGKAEPTITPMDDTGDIGFALSVRRVALDDLVVQRALHSPTVELEQGIQVTGVEWEGDRLVGVTVKTSSGLKSVRAKVVVGADGRHSLIARSCQPHAEYSDPPTRALYYQYVRDFSPPRGDTFDGPEFSILENEIAYTFPSDNQITCVALSVHVSDFPKLKKHLQRGFRERIARHGGLAARFAASRPEGRLLGCGPEQNYIRVPYGPGWALVGDAGFHQDPVTGWGMDHASTHASFLAESLIGWFNGDKSETEAMETYHRRRNEASLQDYQGTVTIAKDMRMVLQELGIQP